jgi:hypothetical protein
MAIAPGNASLYAGAVAMRDLDASGAPTATITNNPVAGGAVTGVAVDCAGNIFLAMRDGTGQIYDSTFKPLGMLRGGTVHVWWS